MARVCTRCGSRMASALRFCPQCGAFSSRVGRIGRTLRLSAGVDPSEKRLGVERTKAGLSLMAIALTLYSVPVLGVLAVLPGALGAGFMISGSRPFRGNHGALANVGVLLWSVGTIRLYIGWQALSRAAALIPTAAEGYYQQFFLIAAVCVMMQVAATALMFVGLQDDRGIALVTGAGFIHGVLASIFLYAAWGLVLAPGGTDGVRLQEDLFFFVSLTTMGNVSWVPVALRTRGRLVKGRIPLRRTEIDLRIE